MTKTDLKRSLWLRRMLRTVVLTVFALPVVMLLLSALLLVPVVQQWVADKLARSISERLGNTVVIGHVYLTPFGPLELDEVYVSDLQGDTLIRVDRLRVGALRVHPRSRLLKTAYVELDGARFKLATAAGDSTSNLTNLLARLERSGDTTAASPWALRCRRFHVNGLHFSYHDANREAIPFGVDFRHVDVRDARLAGESLVVAGDTIAARLSMLSLRESSGLVLEELSGHARVGGDAIALHDMVLRTARSDLRGALTFATAGWADYDDFTQRVAMRLDLAPSRLEFADIALFAPELQGIELPITIAGRVRGTVAQLKGRGLEIGFGERSFFKGSAELTGLPRFADTFMLLDVDELSTNHRDLADLPIPPFQRGARLDPPEEVKALGDVSFNGNFTGFPEAFTAFGRFGTDLGALRTDISYRRDTLSGRMRIAGRAATERFIVGPLLGTRSLGPLAANIRIDAEGRRFNTMTADITGEFPLFTVEGRTITAITANGRLDPNRFDGQLTVRDPKLQLDFSGLADLRGRWPQVDFKARLQHADLDALAIAPGKYRVLSADIEARGQLAPDSLTGTIRALDISYCVDTAEYDLGDIELTSGRLGDQAHLVLDASFAFAEVTGRFLPTQVPDAVENVVYSVFPALREQMAPRIPDQDFRFSLRTKDTHDILGLFVPGLQVDSGAVVDGWLHSRSLGVGLEARLPTVRYYSTRFDAVELLFDKTVDVLAFRVKSRRQQLTDSLWLAGTTITGKAYQDELDLAASWDTSSTGTRGNLDLLGEVLGRRSMHLELLPSLVQLGRGDWTNTRRAAIDIDSSTVRITGFEMSNNGQRVALDGTISRDTAAHLAFELDSVRLENLHPYVSRPYINGTATGRGRLYALYEAPRLISDLALLGLSVEHKPVGDLSFRAAWGDGRPAIDLSGMLTRGPLKALDFTGSLALDEARSLDVSLIMDRFDLAFIDPYLPEGISDIQGRVTGTLAVTGALSDPQVNGEVDLVDAGVRIDYLNTTYRFTHRLRVMPDLFALDLVRVRDEEGNIAMVSGTVIHRGLRDWNYNIWGTMDRMLVLNTTLSDNDLYYGKAYATGDMEISGHAGSLEVVVDARTAPGTDVRFPVGGSTEVSAIGFVHFVSGDTALARDTEVDLSGVTLDMKVAVTPDARFELIFDPTVGDVLSGRGRGNIEMEVDRAGQFVMRGTVEVTEGDYLFTLRNVVNKRFQLQPGGRITWFGDPFDALLDVQAIYRVRAPLYDVVFDKNEAYKRRVPVDVVMDLRDKLLNPEIGFAVRLPTVDESVRMQVQSVMSTEQELNRQVFALIVLNRFVPPPAYGGQGSAPNVAGTTGSELLSNQVSNWLSKLSNDFDLGLNYRPGDNITQDELEVALSTQLLNEKLLFSTNVGVQYGGQATGSANNVVGDFQLEYLLPPDGKLRLKAFSVSNDRNLNRADQALTTQGAGVAYREEFDSWSEFWKKAGRLFAGKRKEGS